MANVRLTLTGFEHTLKQLRRAPELFHKHAASAVGISSIELADRARALAPQDTGNLKRSITWDHTDGSLNGGAGVTSGAFYWWFLEHGTVNMTARPFFRPAAEEYRARFEQNIREIGPDVEAEMERGA